MCGIDSVIGGGGGVGRLGGLVLKTTEGRTLNMKTSSHNLQGYLVQFVWVS